MKDYHHIMGKSQEVSNNIMKNGFALGCHQHVNEEAIDYIVKNIEEFIAQKSAQGQRKVNI